MRFFLQSYWSVAYLLILMCSFLWWGNLFNLINVLELQNGYMATAQELSIHVDLQKSQVWRHFVLLEIDQFSNFPCSLTRNITSHSVENLALHSLLKWKIIILPILNTSLIHLFLKGWENVPFQLGSERANKTMERRTFLSSPYLSNLVPRLFHLTAGAGAVRWKSLGTRLLPFTPGQTWRTTLWSRPHRAAAALPWAVPAVLWRRGYPVPTRGPGNGEQSGNMYLTSLPLVNVRRHGHVTRWMAR